MRLAWMLLCTLLNAATIQTNFESGSLGRIEKLSETHFRIGVKGEQDQDGRNRQASWYYFEVKGAPKTEMTLDLVDLAGEYNYAPNRGAISQQTPPVISYDGKTWTHLDNVEYDGVEPRLRLRIKPEKKRFCVAHTPPYTNQDLRKLRSDYRGHPDFQVKVIGSSIGKRELFLWTIHQNGGSGAKTVWLMFRQHSWESGSSWVGEGAVRALLASTPEAIKLRREVILENSTAQRP
ncbi:MAG: M14-type cytosolic carboxypeptidase [Hymenobacter sp.]